MSHATDALRDLDRTPIAGADLEAATAIRATAGAAATLLAAGADRAELLEAAQAAVDPREAAACALAAALAGIAAPDVDAAVATFLGVATGALGGVANVALADPGTGAVRHLLSQSSPDAGAGRAERMGELFVAGTLTRVAGRHVSLEEGIEALDVVARAAAEVDALDLDDLLTHVYGPLTDEVREEPGSRAALVGGAIPLAAIPRITGGLLAADEELQRKGWRRAAALLAELGRLAGVELTAAGTQAGAARMASDPRLLGDPATTIADVLTAALGLQAAVALGGAGDGQPVEHLVARLVAHTALVA